MKPGFFFSFIFKCINLFPVIFISWRCYVEFLLEPFKRTIDSGINNASLVKFDFQGLIQHTPRQTERHNPPRTRFQKYLGTFVDCRPCGNYVINQKDFFPAYQCIIDY